MTIAKAWRIAGASFPVFDGTGAERAGGRWNSAGRKAIYASASFAIALLERLVQTGLGRIPGPSRFVEIDIPEDLTIESVLPDTLPGWDHPDLVAARGFGDHWLSEGRTAILSVPSAVTRIDRNLVLNPSHPDFARLVASDERPVTWDHRLFGRASP